MAYFFRCFRLILGFQSFSAMLTDNQVSEILGLFQYMQVVTTGSLQQFQREDPYRLLVLIAVYKNREIDYVFVNVNLSKFTPWQRKTWDRRKEKVSAEAFEKISRNQQITRLGFR